MYQWDESIYINGWVSGAAGVHEVTEAATGQALAVTGLAGATDVDTAVDAATGAQKQWAALSSDQHAAGILHIRDNLTAATEELTHWLVREAGATRAKAQREIRAAQAELTHAAELTQLETNRELLTDDRRHQIRRTPAGVVGVITPFNAPLVLAMRAIAPALAFGNAIVLKPDPRTAVSGGLLYPTLFEAAGIPAGLLSVLPGGKDVGERLSEHPAIASILFTGSTPAGRQVGQSAGRTLKRVGLELGGNNPVLVLDDADVEQAANRAVTSSFLHSGQICMTAGQYLIDQRIYADFVDAFTERATQLRVGDPWADETVDMGPIIDDTSIHRLTGIVDRSLSEGATRRVGGTPRERYFPATVLTDVPKNAAAWREEAFGPIAPVRPMNGIEEGLSTVASSPYGLVAAIHTTDPERGKEIATRITAGTVRINDVTNHDDPHTPMAGHQASGNGAPFGGHEILELLTALQLISET